MKIAGNLVRILAMLSWPIGLLLGTGLPFTGIGLILGGTATLWALGPGK